jgi:hypothetical protein
VNVKTIVAMFAVVIALVIFFLVMAGPGITSPSPSPSASPPPAPAGAELVARALKSRKAATKAHAALSRVRRCFGDSAPVRVGKTPERAATAAVWEKARAHWRHQAKDWRQKFEAGRHLMTHPPGAASGAKWLPLAKWVGWPKRALHTLAGLIWCESSGIKTNISPTDDWGLTQLNRPSWAAEFRQRMHVAFEKGALDPELNLAFALWIWKSQGGHFKPAWARDPAVEAVE